MRDRRAHCLDGALLAAAALRVHGEAPLIVDMRAVRDDDHVITIFRRRGHVGAIAKSNMSGLRYRDAIYRDVRELVMSYFDLYYNTDGDKSLRSYSHPLDLRRFDALAWEVRDEAVDTIVERLDASRHTPLLSNKAIAELQPVDARSYQAGMLGVDEKGLYAADRIKREVYEPLHTRRGRSS
jgi:hypothetical protein